MQTQRTDQIVVVERNTLPYATAAVHTTAVRTRTPKLSRAARISLALMAPPHRQLLLLLVLALLLAAPPATADDAAAQAPPLLRQFYYYSPPPPSSPLAAGAPPPPQPPVPCNCETKTPPGGIYNYSAPAGQHGFLSGSRMRTGGRLHPRLFCAAAAALLLLVWWC